MIRKPVDTRIDARGIWLGDVREARHLYRIFVHFHGGRFKSICNAYGWKPEPMLKALRLGRHAA